MGKIYVGQTSLRIELTALVDITGASTKEIRYRKPDGTTGAWDAISDDDATGVLYYDLDAVTDLDQALRWEFWTYVTFSDGRSAPGEPVTLQVYEQLDA